MSTPRHQSTDPDLDWQAFLYVTGEMSADEAGAFEVLLADDQSAREAVAAAVEIVTSIASAGPMAVAAPTAPAPPLRRRGRVLATIAGAIAVCGSCAWWLARPSGDSQRVDLAGVPDLLALWSDPDAGWQEDDEDSGPTTDDDSDELVVPDWMLAAVSGTEDPAEEN